MTEAVVTLASRDIFGECPFVTFAWLCLAEVVIEAASVSGALLQVACEEALR